jgi:hypothetical protein
MSSNVIKLATRFSFFSADRVTLSDFDKALVPLEIEYRPETYVSAHTLCAQDQ